MSFLNCKQNILSVGKMDNGVEIVDNVGRKQLHIYVKSKILK